MRAIIPFFIFFLALLAWNNALDWQGTGNMSESNMTMIWTHINSNFNKAYPYSTLYALQDTKLANYAVSLSNYLNGLWDPAWNVVIVYIAETTTPNSDSVVYGYAFREHWMWFNGFRMDDGRYCSFIIWKDYNCDKWYTLNNNMGTSTLASYTST